MNSNIKLPNKIKVNKSKANSKIPVWFQEWNKQIFMSFVNAQLNFNKQVSDFMKDQIAFNKQVSDFMKDQAKFNIFVLEQFKKHKWVK